MPPPITLGRPGTTAGLPGDGVNPGGKSKPFGGAPWLVEFGVPWLASDDVTGTLVDVVGLAIEQMTDTDWPEVTSGSDFGTSDASDLTTSKFEWPVEAGRSDELQVKTGNSRKYLHLIKRNIQVQQKLRNSAF